MRSPALLACMRPAAATAGRACHGRPRLSRPGGRAGAGALWPHAGGAAGPAARGALLVWVRLRWHRAVRAQPPPDRECSTTPANRAAPGPRPSPARACACARPPARPRAAGPSHHGAMTGHRANRTELWRVWQGRPRLPRPGDRTGPGALCTCCAAGGRCMLLPATHPMDAWRCCARNETQTSGSGL